MDKYIPIDYRRVVFSRKGDIIRPFLSIVHNKIWDNARPYIDSRDDPGHTENCTNFAIELIKKYDDSDPNIVLPAAICHDIGWDINPIEFKDIVNSGKSHSKDFRLRHQVRGVKITSEILNSLDYPKGYTADILEIISDHDTRYFLPRTINEKIMRDSDILFRVTRTMADIYCKNKTPDEIFHLIQGNLDKRDKFYLDYSRNISRIEFVNTIYSLDRNYTNDSINKEYKKELELIKEFYMN
jgi:HD superfamily phosphodiesterase